MNNNIAQRNRNLLLTVRQLQELIVGSNQLANPVDELADKLDAFMAALHQLKPWLGFSIESIDADIPKRIPGEMLQLIRRRFPTLENYQFLATSRMTDNGAVEKPEVLVANSINDLCDIATELHEVIVIQDNHGDEEALRALAFRYATHLYMHIPPLRFHLEELLSGR